MTPKAAGDSSGVNRARVVHDRARATSAPTKTVPATTASHRAARSPWGAEPTTVSPHASDHHAVDHASRTPPSPLGGASSPFLRAAFSRYAQAKAASAMTTGV